MANFPRPARRAGPSPWLQKSGRFQRSTPRSPTRLVPRAERSPVRSLSNSQPALDKTASIVEHRHPNALWREALNRTELRARVAVRPSSSRADAATAVYAAVSAVADAFEKGRHRQHRRVRQVRHQPPRDTAGPQSPLRRTRRHPRQHRADLQGRQGPSRHPERLAWRTMRSGCLTDDCGPTI